MICVTWEDQDGIQGLVIARQTEVTYKLEIRVGAKIQFPIIKARDKGQVDEELGPPKKEL